MTPRPASAHPLDTDLLDYVEGVADRAARDQIESHLRRCVVCRIKRQRLAGVPPMDFVDPHSVVAPTFTPLATEPAAPEDAQSGELWFTTGDEAAMVLVRSVQRGGGAVVVVPVALDIEVADDSVLVLDEDASPLAVPIAIWESLIVSLPTDALSGRVLTRGVVDVLAVGTDDVGVSRGTPLEGAADPRHEVRQYLVDRLAALDTYDEDEADDEDGSSRPERLFDLVRSEFAWRRPWCDVQRLMTLPVPEELSDHWIAVCRVVDFTTHVAVIQTPSGLSAKRDVEHAQALLVRLNASALAVCTPNTDVVDLYDPPALFGATNLPAGTRSAGPLITGLSMVDALEKYLEQKRLPLSVVAGPAQTAPRVDVAAVLAAAVDAAVNEALGRASRFGPEKRAGYEHLGGWKTQLTETLHSALEPGFDPATIEGLVDEDRR